MATSVQVQVERSSPARPRRRWPVDYKVLLGDAYDLAKHGSAARKVWREASAHGSAIAAARLQR